MKSPQSIKQKTTIRFSTTLSRSITNQKIKSKNLLPLPKSVNSKLPSQAKMIVEGIISSFPFRTTLESDSKGNYYLKVSKAMYDAVGVNKESIVTVEITRIGEEVETRIPSDLRKALIVTPRAQTLWSEITPIARRDWIYWIISAKRSETRRRRINIACDKLVCGKGRVCCFGGIEWLKKQRHV